MNDDMAKLEELYSQLEGIEGSDDAVTIDPSMQGLAKPLGLTASCRKHVQRTDAPA
jgi:hypothetical protein